MKERARLDETTEAFKQIKNEWYTEAKEMTLDKLPGFISHLTDDYNHDYGTICHAMSAGAIATMWAMDKSDQGGITGFQAGAIMWEFIRTWNYPSNSLGLRIIDFDKMLYPQHASNFDKTISESTWNRMKMSAKKNLNENETAHPNVILHWESIVAGNVPFGYTVLREKVK